MKPNKNQRMLTNTRPMLFIALAGLTIVGLANPATAMDLVCGPEYHWDEVADLKCKQGSGGGGNGGPVQLLHGSTIVQLTGDVSLPNQQPVAYLGIVQLTIAGAKATAVGVGVASPCEAYSLLLQCVVNPLVPTQALYATGGGTGIIVDLPELCLKSATLLVDVNGDGFREAEAPALAVGNC